MKIVDSPVASPSSPEATNSSCSEDERPTTVSPFKKNIYQGNIVDLQSLCFPKDFDVTLFGVNQELRQISERTNESIVELTTSRMGRDLQRYETYNGVSCRLTAGCVPILADGSILLISSSKNPYKFVLAKGGWELDESLHVSALRETFEECGVTGILGPPLPTITYETRKGEELRKLGKVSQGHSHNRMTIFPLYVQSIYSVWPEQMRQRKSVSLSQAIQLVSHRPEIVEVLCALQKRQQQPICVNGGK